MAKKRKQQVRADENVDVLNEKDYEEDRQVHNPDVREGSAPDRKDLEDGESEAAIESSPPVDMPNSEPADDDVLSQPARYVVDSGDAIERVDVLLDKIEEARPDLAEDVAVLRDGMDQLEQKNYGRELANPAPADEAVGPLPEDVGAEDTADNQFSAGDPVEVDTDDGTYTGSLLDQNEDGTWEVETDKHVTLSRVPEEHLRPIEAAEGMTLPAALSNVNLHITGDLLSELERLRSVFVNGADLRELLESKDPEELEQIVTEWKERLTDVGDQLREPEFFQNAIREAEEVLEMKRSGSDQEVAVAAKKKKETGVKAKEQGMKPLSTSSQDHQTAHSPGNPYAGLPKEDKAPTGGKEQQAKDLKTSSQEHFMKENKGDPYADAPKKDEEVAAAAPTDGQAMTEPKHKSQEHFTKSNSGDPYPGMGGDRRSTGSDAAGASGEGGSSAAPVETVEAAKACDKCDKSHEGECEKKSDVKAAEEGHDDDKKMCADCKKPEDVCKCAVEASKKTAGSKLTDAVRADIKAKAKAAATKKAEAIKAEFGDDAGLDPVAPDASTPAETEGESSSAFEEVEELDLGGGWKARRKKGKEDSAEDKPTDAAGAPEAPEATDAPETGDDLPGAPADADAPGGTKSPIPVASVKAGENPFEKKDDKDSDDDKDDKKDDDKDDKDDKDKDSDDKDDKKDKKSESVSKPKDYDGPSIEVVDPDGKVVAEYPDAFGDDTVTIIKMLQQLHDIKEDAEKKDDDSKDDDSKSEKKDDDAPSIEDKPKALPTVETKEEDNEALAAAQKIMEARVTAAREVIKEEKEKGYVVADMKDIDDALLAGKSEIENGQEVKTPITLEAATDAAVDKAMDRRFKELLAMPDAELLMIKASLPNLPRKAARVEIQASQEGLEPIAAITVHAEDNADKDFSIGDAFAFRGFGS